MSKAASSFSKERTAWAEKALLSGLNRQLFPSYCMRPGASAMQSPHLKFFCSSAPGLTTFERLSM